MKLYTILKLDEYFIRNHIIIIIIKRLNSNEYKKEDDGIITINHRGMALLKCLKMLLAGDMGTQRRGFVAIPAIFSMIVFSAIHDN